MMNKNHVWRSYIGQGYYGTITPTVIQRNIFENPGWYTAYTPYQPEISQGRLEALFNYQTMVSDLTGLPRANASLLDEGTAAAEAMCLAVRHTKKRKFLVDTKCHLQTIDVVTSRAKDIEVEIEMISLNNIDHVKKTINTGQYAGYLLQYPDTEGDIWDQKIRLTAEWTKLNKVCLEAVGGNIEQNSHTFQLFLIRTEPYQITYYATIVGQQTLLIMATDLMVLTLIESPGSLGADIAIGSSQRFGVPMGFGGPHAAFISATETLTRLLPGRIVGLSK
ncbi:unnamed protein product [Trichobilharzia regenti]|nr:unnamed protein product [Trichobilharzia regenti]